MRRSLSVFTAGVFSVSVTYFIFTNVGLVPAVIIGGSAIISFFVWLFTTYNKPVNPDKIVPLYLLAVAGQIIHTGEEYIADFPGHLTGLFHLQNLDKDTFALGVFIIAAAIWVLAAYGLLKKHPLANYFLWFFLIGPGIVNALAHTTFPFIAKTAYFPGLLTVLIPTLLSLIIIRDIIKDI